MDWTETMTPAIAAILVTLGLAGIGYIVWLVRLEGKTNTGTKDIADLKSEHAREIAEIKSNHARDIVELKQEHGDDIREVKEELKDTRERFFKHVADVGVHHNAEAVLEFRNALDRRLDNFDKSFADISRKLNHMTGRE
jgi:hypothetical protein